MCWGFMLSVDSWVQEVPPWRSSKLDEFGPAGAECLEVEGAGAEEVGQRARLQGAEARPRQLSDAPRTWGLAIDDAGLVQYVRRVF